MAVAKRTFEARVILSLLKSGSGKFRDHEIAEAMIEAEQAVNNLKLPEKQSGVKTYIRLHINEEVKGAKGDIDNGEDKD